MSDFAGIARRPWHVSAGLTKACRNSPTFLARTPEDTALVAVLLAAKGDREAAREKVARLQLKADNLAGLSHLHHTQYYIGAAYALVGDTRQAVSWLKKASREGLPCFPLFERDRNLDGLRQDAEFAAFMQELKAQAERFRSTL